MVVTDHTWGIPHLDWRVSVQSLATTHHRPLVNGNNMKGNMFLLSSCSMQFYTRPRSAASLYSVKCFWTCGHSLVDKSEEIFWECLTVFWSSGVGTHGTRGEFIIKRIQVRDTQTAGPGPGHWVWPVLFLCLPLLHHGYGQKFYFLFRKISKHDFRSDIWRTLFFEPYFKWEKGVLSCTPPWKVKNSDIFKENWSY